MLDRIWNLLVGLVRSRTATLIALSLVASGLLTTGIAAIIAIKEIGADGALVLVDVPFSARVLIAAVLVVLFFVIWFILHLQYQKDAEDIYSRLRDKLSDRWLVRYTLRDGADDVTPALIVACDALVNPQDLKLEFVFHVTQNPIWKDARQSISTIALRHEKENRYTLTYYFKGVRQLQPAIAAHVVPETGADPEDVEIEVFGILEFEDIATSKQIEHMEGQWFDLNGNIIRVSSLVHEIAAEQRAGRFLQKRLSDATINQGNFAASMGRIDFQRN